MQWQDEQTATSLLATAVFRFYARKSPPIFTVVQPVQQAFRRKGYAKKSWQKNGKY